MNVLSRTLGMWAVLLCGFAAAQEPVVQHGTQQVKVDITPQPLRLALTQFAQQTGVQLLFSEDEVPMGIKAPGLVGTYTLQTALKELLARSKLRAEFINARTVAIRSATSAEREATVPTSDASAGRVGPLILAQAPPEVRARTGAEDANGSDAPAASEKGIPEILVKGKRSLNADIERTEDAVQPYVVFGGEEIQRSQAVNLEEFLRTRLPMNTASGSSSQTPGSANTTSGVNLRGLGTNQTLILVDGRRLPVTYVSGRPAQPDLNGIPLAAIERIEVLPSTAGGIYGGSATGGVINIVMRRDFDGMEGKITYANTADTDAANVRFDANAGFSLEGGRTRVTVAATRSEANNLVFGDRDLMSRAIALQLRNNPAAITAATTPPLGATVNILSASIVGGVRQPLVLDAAYGNRALGQTVTHIPLGYAGPASDGGAALITNAGRYNLDLPGGVLGLERGLVAAPSMESASLNVRREFGAHVEAFVDLSRLGNNGRSFSADSLPNAVANLAASAPNNPFQQAISVRFPVLGMSFETLNESTTVRATGGLIARLPRNWTAGMDYSWNRSRILGTTTAFVVDSVGSCVLGRGLAAGVDPDGAGTATPCAANDTRPALNILQEGNTFPLDLTPYLLPTPNAFNGPSDTVLKNATLRFSGPVLNLPGGPLSLSVLVERRDEGMQDSVSRNISTITREPVYAFIPGRSQDANSWYVEARTPLVRELELQASVRRDEYKTRTLPSFATVAVPSPEGPFPTLNFTTTRLDSTDYTLGLRYMPFEDLTLRTSFGTGFLPPSVIQIVPTLMTTSFSLGSDPRRGNTPMYVGVPFTWTMGGNPGLKPENSESWSAGAILTPRFAPDLRLSVDYTRIAKVDEIQTPGNQFVLDNEDLLPGRIVRGARLAADPAGWAGPVTSINTTLLNLSRTSLEAYDIQADYTLATERLGEFHWHAIATLQPHYRNQLQPTAAMVDSAGFTGGPLKWRGNTGFTWDRGALTLGWNAQYYHSYFVYTATAAASAVTTATLSQGSSTVPSQIYHDLIAVYRFDPATSWMRGLLANSEISFGIQNLFDRAPPVLASTTVISFGYSTYGDPRMRRYAISLRKSFQGQR